MLFKVTAPVVGYSGVTAGVTFKNGVGETDNKWLATWFKEKGYKVENQEEEKATKNKRSKVKEASE
ncbi:hypothetical protein [Petroclostridium sp. X23]|uniref:hypothetical protein n=1 Tax=Petroclostridium sp. X23 TaxID=3045146 RepID=UPI0024AE6DF1|nr:hypothetical protein [Petroclostridium sp. X23]WHH58480.1 hypothetical protein QKW49_22205 [Petroclostridium sp. X23]